MGIKIKRILNSDGAVVEDSFPMGNFTSVPFHTDNLIFQLKLHITVAFLTERKYNLEII